MVPQPMAPSLMYYPEEGVENLDGYCPGGYHPTHLGDRYHNERYEIVHKLGFGSSSTVWLAKDHIENRFVALRILTAEASSEEEETTELEVCQALSSGNQDHPGRRHVLGFFDHFTIDGPNGSHRCIVSEPVGCSAGKSKDEYAPWMFPPNAARSMAAQVLLGLDYIHSCGVVHSDLHSRNILYRLPDFSNYSIEEIYRQFGEPQQRPITRLDEQLTGQEAPNYCVSPMITAEECSQVPDSVQVVIAGFGEAFFPEKIPLYPRKVLNTPTLLMPPEAIFGEHPDSAVDIWTLGCTIYDLLGNGSLLKGFMPDEDDVVAEIISTFGQILWKWTNKWSKKRDFFRLDGTWKQETGRAHVERSRPLKERIEGMGREGEFSSEEMECLEDLLRQMLFYDPDWRIKASRTLESEWMLKWGRPAMEHGAATAAASQSEQLMSTVPMLDSDWVLFSEGEGGN
ncbi:CMGC/SRPK protein kinase [Polytolypa hystricis UAMH7299]|uniref:non-specific serine/threonine protein kinase n=1 Tax=Polytolypa hystricis (strain UAMH7299) TaxID=1447883 RepID=A0A2B7XTJ0_POLH7|nr:CMGC/SRPK protein kinase [Polytolypa hystricis UAMH7299]